MLRLNWGLRAGNKLITSNMEHKERLKDIISRLPFTPTAPIGRKEFFIGLIVITVVSFLFSIGITVLLGESNIFVVGAIALIASYVTATWSVKRFLDIRPETKARLLQIVLFASFLVLNILTYIQVGMLKELRAFSDYVVTHGLGADGAPEVSAFTLSYGTPVSIARAVIGILLLIFVLVLLVKKGREVKN